MQFQHYIHRDALPLVDINYYRLQQFDFDGASSFSPIQTVAIQNNKGLQVTLYPNPATDRLTVKVNGKSNGIYPIEVYNAVGQRMAIPIRQVSTNEPSNLEVNQWTAGLYFLLLRDERGNIVNTVRFYKQ